MLLKQVNTGTWKQWHVGLPGDGTKIVLVAETILLLQRNYLKISVPILIVQVLLAGSIVQVASGEVGELVDDTQQDTHSFFA